MQDKEMIEIIEGLELGADIEIDIEAIGGVVTEIGKYKGGFQQDGYYKPSGGWGCYGGEGWKPCYQFYFQEKGKRKIYIMIIGYKVLKIRTN